MTARHGWWGRWRAWFLRCVGGAGHLDRGRLGEDAARRYLKELGWTFLTSNYRARRGEIDLVFRDGDCLVFVEVKTRTEGGRTRPAAAVNRRKRRLLSLSALEYLRELKEPRVPMRFDVVEVLLRHASPGEVVEVRHLPRQFTLSAPYRLG